MDGLGEALVNVLSRPSPAGRRIDVTTSRAGAVRSAAMLRLSRAALALFVAGLAAAPLAAALPTPPPPAILTAGSKKIRPALGSYCWSNGGAATCVDMIPPQRRPDIPILPVARGTRIGIALRFTARVWNVAPFGSTSKTRLPPGRTAAFRASQSGIFAISIEKSANGSASYLVRLRVR